MSHVLRSLFSATLCSFISWIRDIYLFIWFYFFLKWWKKHQHFTFVLSDTHTHITYSTVTTILSRAAPNARIYEFYINGGFINVIIPWLLKNLGLMLFLSLDFWYGLIWSIFFMPTDGWVYAHAPAHRLIYVCVMFIHQRLYLKSSGSIKLAYCTFPSVDKIWILFVAVSECLALVHMKFVMLT